MEKKPDKGVMRVQIFCLKLERIIVEAPQEFSKWKPEQQLEWADEQTMTGAPSLVAKIEDATGAVLLETKDWVQWSEGDRWLDTPQTDP